MEFSCENGYIVYIFGVGGQGTEDNVQYVFIETSNFLLFVFYLDHLLYFLISL